MVTCLGVSCILMLAVVGQCAHGLRMESLSVCVVGACVFLARICFIIK